MVYGTRLLLVLVGLIASLLLGLAPAVAEKPLSSPAQLAAGATHVVRGDVVRVLTRVRRTGTWEDTDYVAEVKVAAVEKGEGIRLDRPLYARYWRKDWKGPGYPPPGTGGHSGLPREGAAVRLYLARNANDGFGTGRYDGGYDVIGKNGIQTLTPAEVRQAESEAAPKTVLTFPASWRGVWAGTLTIAKPGRDVEQTDTFIAIAPTEDPQRRYELVVLDAAAGRYAIDEKNGIVLPATYLDGELFSYFSLDGNLLLARYRLVGDTLHFDLTQTGLAPDTQTGGGGVSEWHPAYRLRATRNARTAYIPRAFEASWSKAT